VATIVSAPFEQNTYVAHLEGRTDCLVVDPGMQWDKIVAYLNETGLNPVALLITHAHGDHIAGNGAMKKRFPECPLVIGRKEAPKLTDPRLNLSAQYGMPLVSPEADVLLDEGDVYRAAGFELEVRDIPGHSTGHVVFVWQVGRPAIVFGGDVLFAGSVGRTDFPDGSFEDLASAIHNKLFTLPDDTIVLPGHGPPTTVGEEKRTNPYVGGQQ
jgi:glyoxylase-like metal-dependent hydrolase (beta-lactamase superfamily II)